ncbi:MULTISPECIES: YitT family protein [Aneurinibacillus]|uniref:Uncharacterized 5xTM membrane BCR, YitT family COG1284 n=1 Tax=Aneurinibacillus thermoaerophilus TaxID=143495 RepID=A0A1G8CR27_ANETH|nr:MULTISPECIES: YitT family protein [Aneurinibacillus]AMA71835.1 hypothetical protein ACH33_02590 [Aneurinibacillus sp. XH2]MED0677199.1 YitT family protein [Aneurinibacillus thermoaerophilus]MED0680493.1 YitT family protein [Aneurinibacillus thermoaerophilus]MED0737247.1 YitT family protein [Aneurinibacillus thermoaerophilus]MED0757938.1 YitT family protein [Aneurinibacillus thermoaerophilus]
MRKQSIRSVLMILLGTFILAFGYYHINFQNNLLEGGFVGLSLLLKYVFDFSPAITILLFDLPFFILILFKKSPQFILKTALGTFAFSLFYELCELYSPLIFDFSHMMVLASVLSGIITGYGAGLVLRYGGTTGGEDLLCLFISKGTGISIGTVFLILDLIVLGLSSFFLPLDKLFYTILAVIVAGKVITWTVHFGEEKEGEQQLSEQMI